MVRFSALFAALWIGSTHLAAAATLESVKERGKLVCGVNTGLTGFSEINDDARWVGFDVDFCRAVAAAVLGDGEAVTFKPTTPQERFAALQSGEVDLLSRNTTWTFTRDVKLGFTFAGVSYYDGQGFMVPKALGVTSAKQLSGARICIETGTTTELNLSDYFRTNGMEYTSVVLRTSDDSRRNYLANACDAYTTDVSGLAAMRSTFPDPDAHIILPEVISKEPLGPLVRQGDDQWADIVRWTLMALVLAEELKITKANVAETAQTSRNPEIRRLLGQEGDFGPALGLTDSWALNAIVAVGNYGEIFERSVGKSTPLGLERDLNGLWSQGGLHYALPVR